MTSAIDERLAQLLPMPEVYKYVVESVKEPVFSSSEGFNAKFTVNVSNAEEFSEWMEKFQNKSHTQFNTEKTIVCDGRYVTFKKVFKCHHNVRDGVVGLRKHTSCTAKAIVTIRHCPKRIRKDQTKVNPDGLCLVDLKWEHNHPILAADAVRHLGVTSETDRKLIHLFQNGHSPSSALEYLKMDLEDNLLETDQLEQVLANRSVCPDYRHCHYLFTKEFQGRYGDPHANDKLEEYSKATNTELGEVSIKVEEFNSRQIVAICMPLMKRVHQHIQESSELVFVDSSGGFDRDGYRIFVFMTHSKAGGLPLAVAITPSETTEALTRLFGLVKQVLPVGSFFGRGADQGPMLFMTDDSAAEQAALRKVWPL